MDPGLRRDDGATGDDLLRTPSPVDAGSGRPVVVKFGGSLVESGGIAGWVAAVAAARRPLVIVPGGGRFADQVREAQAQLRFPDRTAHRMAILAMHQTGLMLEALNSRLEAVETLAAMRRSLAGGGIPIWLPLRIADRDAGIPADWSITSDGLAARLAELLPAAAVLLVKSARVDRAASAHALARRGVVDPTFVEIVERTGLPWRILGPGEEGALGEAEVAGPRPVIAAC